QDLSNFVIAEDTLLDISAISRFPLHYHVKLQKALSENSPELAKKLYQHNTSLQTLAYDIKLFDDNGVAPLAAIEALIKGLILGGERMTGQMYAGSSANKAIERFFSWFNELPEPLQKNLRELTYDNGKTLGNIIDD